MRALLWTLCALGAVACGDPTTYGAECEAEQAATRAALESSSYDTKAALDRLVEAGDTGRRNFMVLYDPGMTPADLDNLAQWGGEPYFDPSRPELVQVSLTLQQAVELSGERRVERIVPGALYADCPLAD